MRFQRTQKPRNYLARSEQWRLLLMVLALGAVVVLMVEARNPQNWAWLWGGKQPQAGDQARQGSPPAQIDNRLSSSKPKGLPPDTVMVEPPPPGPEQIAAEAVGGGFFPGVEPQHLAAMRDDRRTRREEWPAWSNLLNVLYRTDEETLEKASLGKVAYNQLFRQSSVYRGRLVTIRGRVHGVFRYPLVNPELDAPVDEYYQVWLYPEDSPMAPVMTYCLFLPPGFPTGDMLDEEATITGFFLKRTAYESRDDNFRTAPTVLARTLHWIRPPEVAPPAGLAPWQWGALIGGSLVFGLLAAWLVYQITRPGRPGAAQEDSAQSPPSFDALP